MEYLSSWMSKVSRGGGGWWGGQEIDFKMECLKSRQDSGVTGLCWNLSG